jgi:hypothetical protein
MTREFLPNTSQTGIVIRAAREDLWLLLRHKLRPPEVHLTEQTRTRIDRSLYHT